MPPLFAYLAVIWRGERSTNENDTGGQASHAEWPVTGGEERVLRGGWTMEPRPRMLVARSPPRLDIAVRGCSDSVTASGLTLAVR